MDGFEMFGGVFVFGGIAAADMAAGHAKAKVDPAIAYFEAFFAAAGVRGYFVDLVGVSAFRHDRLLSNMVTRKSSNAVDSLQAWPAIEIRIEAQDRPDTVAFHDCDVERVARRHECAIMHNFSCPQDVGFIDGNYFINYIQNQLERGSDGLVPADGRIAVKYLLQDFGISHQTLTRSYQSLEDELRFCLMRVTGPGKAHRDV